MNGNSALPLVVENLSFRYLDRSEFALQGVSFEVREGEVVLVGRGQRLREERSPHLKAAETSSLRRLRLQHLAIDISPQNPQGGQGGGGQEDAQDASQVGPSDHAKEDY